MAIELNFEGKSIMDLRTLVRGLRDELAAATDPKRADELAQALGATRDRMKDLNEQTAIFTAGSKFEIMSNSLADVGSKLKDLDFEGARESAQRLISISQTLTFGEAIKGVKDLGSTFMSLGKALLTNPLFLIAGAITLIVVGIVKLMEKAGLMKVVMDQLGKAMAVVNGIIDGVVQSLKDFTDWLGWTDNKAIDSAQKQADAANKIASAYEDKSDRVVATFDHEIAMLEISGRSTDEVEARKLNWMAIAARTKAEAAVADLRYAKQKGDLDAAEIKALQDKVTETRNAYTEIRYQIQEHNAQVAADNNKANTEANAKAVKDREEGIKQLNDLLDEAKNPFEVDRASIIKRYDDAIKIAEKYLPNTIKQLEDNKNAALKKSEDDFNAGSLEDRAKWVDKMSTEFKNVFNFDKAVAEAQMSELDKLLVAESAKYQAQLASLRELSKTDGKSAGEELKKITSEYIQTVEKLRIADKNNSKEALEQNAKDYQEYIDNYIFMTLEGEDAKRQMIAESYSQEDAARINALDAEQAQYEKLKILYADNKIALEQIEAVHTAKQTEISQDYIDQEKAKHWDLTRAKVDMAQQALTLIGDLNTLFATNSEKSARRAFVIDKAMKLTSATMAGVEGTINAYKTAQASPYTLAFPAYPIIQAGLAATFAAVNVAKIAAMQFGGTTTPTPPPPSSAPATPSFGLYGMNAGGNTYGAGGINPPVSPGTEGPIKVMISEVDITSTQDRIKRMEASVVL